MAPSAIENIPPELQKAIISLIPRPTDLKSLCLTSKQLRNIATSYLYRDVKLDLREWKVGHGFFKQGHPGHKYVRMLSIIPSGYIPTQQAGRSMRQAIRVLLGLIPRDALQEFEVLLWIELDQTTLVTLSKQQRRLTSLALSPIIDELNSKVTDPSNWLLSLRSFDISFYVGSVGELTFYGKAIQSVSKLDYLAFGEGDGSLVKDGRQGSELVYHELFGRRTRTNAEGYRGIEVSKLCLQSVTFQHPFHGLSSGIQLHKLQHLSLRNCYTTSSLLQHLAHLFRESGTCLRGFIYQEESYIGYTDIRVINDFLNSFSGLQRLQVRMHFIESGLDIKCLKKHSSTLEHLYFGSVYDRRGQKQWTVSPGDAISISEQAMQLRQLALPLPELDISKGLNGDLGSFGDFIVRSMN